MNCPSCGAPMRLELDQDRLTCEYCKNIYFPEKDSEGVRVLGVPAEQSCPVCAVPLMHAVLGKERIRYCTRCRGMLIRMGTFISLLHEMGHGPDDGAVPRPADPDDLDRHIDCPECHRPMDTHMYAGPGNVVIDSCSRCYLNWLDYPEMRRIVGSPDRYYRM